MVRNGCGQSGNGTLNLAVLQEWLDGMNWFFACWCKFRKAKSYFNDFWVGLVKNGWSHLIHETLKYVKWVHGANFLHADCDAIILLDQHHTFYFWLLNVNLLQLYLLAPGGNWKDPMRVCPSFPPDIFLSVYLEFDH